MKKVIIILLLVSITILTGFSQCRIVIRYTNPIIRLPAKVTCYRFSTWKDKKLIKEFEVLDSLSCMFIKQRIDSIKSYKKCKSYRFPDVRQQITIFFGEECDTLFSDGSFAMEKNGKCVIFDKILQEAINKAIEDYEQTLPENERLMFPVNNVNSNRAKNAHNSK